MRIGSLFSGAGGLDRAVESVFGGTVAWFSEIDPAASRVLAYHYPGVPNLGSVTDIDWATVPPVDVICGGFPCTDVSAAGKRAGMHGTRSGLWSHMAEAIDVIRPKFVVIENVRGLLNANANRPMEPTEDGLGDGSDGLVLRAMGAVLGDISDIGGYEARWVTLAAASVGAPHRRERVFILASDAGYRNESEWAWQAGREAGERFSVGAFAGCGGEDAAVSGGEPVDLLSTPVAQQSGCSPEDHLRKKPGRKVVTDLAILVENGLLESGGALLPTPRTSDTNGAGHHGDGGMDLRTTVTLLPTPNAQDGNGGGRYSSEGHQSTLPGEARLLCTPSASDGAGGKTSRSGSRIDEPLLGGQAREMETSWGKYAAAIARWEHVTGTPAPAPTEPNKNGNPRLSAAFSSWLMGWPAGWVTDPAIGISRNDQLRIVGNGVVSRQAIAALRYVLSVGEVSA